MRGAAGRVPAPMQVVIRKALIAAASFLCLLTGSGMDAECPAGSWVTLAPMSEPRQEMAVAALDGRVFAIGGLAGRSNANTIYDPVRNTWSLGADYPFAGDHGWAVSLAGRLYAGGGGTNRVFFYDPAADRWTEVVSSAYLHGGTPAAAVIGGLIYVAGGTGGAMTGREVEVYDPASNRWTTLASMSCARNHTAGGAIGGRLYVAGGRPGNQDCLEVYDPATNVWTRKSPMPTGRSGIGGAVVGDCLYVFGGEGNAADPAGIFHQVEAYEASSDRWISLAPMQTARHGISGAVIGNAIYLPGGATNEGFGVTGASDAYLIPLAPALVPRQPVILSPRRTKTPY